MIFRETTNDIEKSKMYEDKKKNIPLIEKEKNTNLDFIKSLNLVEFCSWIVVCNDQLLKKFGIRLTTKQKTKLVYMYIAWFKKKEDKFDLFGRRELVDIDFENIKNIE